MNAIRATVTEKARSHTLERMEESADEAGLEEVELVFSMDAHTGGAPLRIWKPPSDRLGEVIP
jgi:hypothetical protein